VFYTRVGGRLLVSTDLPSLLAAGADPAIDLQAVDCFFARGYLPAPLTFVKSIRKLGPGELLRATPGHTEVVEHYFHPTAIPALTPDKRTRTREIRTRLVSAVARRKAPRGATGVLLSAGVDSSLVLGTLVKECGASAEAFTFHYSNYEGLFNEAERARLLATELGIKHHRITCGPHDLVDSLPALMRAYGEPLTFGLHSFMMHEAKKTGLSVVLTGVGSDGLSISESGFASLAFRALPDSMRAASRWALVRAGTAVGTFAAKTRAALWSEQNQLPSCCYPAIAANDLRFRYYGDKSWAAVADDETRETFACIARHFERESPIAQWRFVGHRAFMAEASLFWNAVWSRAYDIQLRHPFFDNELNDYVMRLGHFGRGKRYIRDVAEQILPEWVANAPKIHQTIPIGDWFRGPLRSFLEEHLNKETLGDLFDVSMIETLKREHIRGRTDHTWRLWSLIAFTVWRNQILQDLTQTVPAVASQRLALAVP
jgi:asparagine synthase (glutamine-hydrolysing)